MIPPDLPAELRLAIERKLHGLSRNAAAQRSTVISQNYRDGGNSRTIRTETDAMAYALARMPATYAAIVAALNALHELLPELAPTTLLDIGAGPGTATWAASESFLALDNASLIDSNPALRALALDLTQDTGLSARINYTLGDAVASLAKADSADLVIASYVLSEIKDSERTLFARQIWNKATRVLLVVEPGTPAGHQRIIALRAQLIADGAHVIAPCPHDHACPLTAPDWCHFSQRLPRSRAHKHLKGADLPFEDEKFSYVALSRTHASTQVVRVLSPPAVSKGTVVLKLCTSDGVQIEDIARQNKESYTRAKKLRWGDSISDLL